MKVVVFSGHSGGHLFPSLAFAEALKEIEPKAVISLVTSQKAKAIVEGMPEVFSSVEYFPDFPFPRGISVDRFLFPIKLLKAFFLSYVYLSKLKPDLAVGFGSYISFPGMMVSRWAKIPTMIHEQNAVPGKATQWLAKHMDYVGLSFDTQTIKGYGQKSEVVGLPMRSQLRYVADHPPQCKSEEASDVFKILIVGGSQGAKRLNQIIFDSFSYFSNEELKKIAVNHVTGQVDYQNMLEQYKKTSIQSKIYPFHREMQNLYLNSDMAITRAGANTLFELALFQIPALVVPYPHADGHQKQNALAFAGDGAILMREEGILSSEELAKDIKMLMSSKQQRESMKMQLARFGRFHAESRLAEVAVNMVKKEGTCKVHAVNS